MTENVPDLSKVDWDSLPSESVQELHRQAEQCLLGTIALATNQDQRATTLCGIFGAGSVALLAAVATLITGSLPSMSLILSAFSAATLLLLASIFCALAVHPSNFFVAGYEPRFLIASAANPVWMLGYSVHDLQIRIAHNRLALERCARWTRWGIWFSGVAVTVGVLTFVTTTALWGPRPF